MNLRARHRATVEEVSVRSFPQELSAAPDKLIGSAANGEAMLFSGHWVIS
jgi:hypothetical protein